jgi:type IV secretory pathway component VirB8
MNKRQQNLLFDRQQNLLIEVREIFEWLKAENEFDYIFNISNPLNINQFEILDKIYNQCIYPINKNLDYAKTIINKNINSFSGRVIID